MSGSVALQQPVSVLMSMTHFNIKDWETAQGLGHHLVPGTTLLIGPFQFVSPVLPHKTIVATRSKQLLYGYVYLMHLELLLMSFATVTTPAYSIMCWKYEGHAKMALSLTVPAHQRRAGHQHSGEMAPPLVRGMGELALLLTWKGWSKPATSQAHIHGFELSLANIYLISYLAEHMEELPTWKSSCRIFMTAGYLRRDSERVQHWWCTRSQRPFILPTKC